MSHGTIRYFFGVSLLQWLRGKQEYSGGSVPNSNLPLEQCTTLGIAAEALAPVYPPSEHISGACDTSQEAHTQIANVNARHGIGYIHSYSYSLQLTDSEWLRKGRFGQTRFGMLVLLRADFA